jgi:hypothetical protein
MRARAGALTLTLLAVVLTAFAVTTLAARQNTPAAGVTVHEWGTFTSVAGIDGQAVEWAPFSGPQDLPCFVGELAPTPITNTGNAVYLKDMNFVSFSVDPGLPAPTTLNVRLLNAWLPSLRATVRMETPVLYFYSPVDASASVRVQFNQGLISEWYPRATVPAVSATPNLSTTQGWIAWPDVKIRPHAEDPFPTDAVKSHYYAARETDAAPLQVDNQFEKFLFYRGLAAFPVTLKAEINSTGEVFVRNTGAGVTNAIVFENDGARMGFRVTGPLGAQQTLSRPALAAGADSTEIRKALEAMLVAEGLYPREAKAMVETWRDSWFEPGVRLIYLVPREMVDAVLPLSITPAPSATARVFVGRVELITPQMEAEVDKAIRANDVPVLMRYGRFLEPIANRVLPRMSIRDQPPAMATLKAVAAKFTAAATVCK